MLRTLGLAGIGLSLASLPEFTLPALAQGETVVPFSDIPATFNPGAPGVTRIYDIRKIDGALTPPDQFFTTQHYGHPTIDQAAYRLRVSGMVTAPLALSLDDLKKMNGRDLTAGFECSGNSPRLMQGFAGNGKWTGIPLRLVLDQAGVHRDAREFVFFGADKGPEEIEWRTQKFTVEQQFGRSLNREQALSGEPFLAWALNGQPLTVHQGSPLRLLVPGWYGVANVKWLSNIHVQSEPYMGKFQTRWYRTLREENIGGVSMPKETGVTKMRLKSVIARVTTNGRSHKVTGYVLNDGTPIRSVEVQVDGGAWQKATLSPDTSSTYSWKLFTFDWNGATPGEHTLVSRVTDTNGAVQPTAADLANKKTFLEDNGQFPRKLTIG
ncbi:MAG TPA: molybdopterin-dependent oxidoreductase [Vicinamibacterales bacterium]|nr:molybdopterin-dependent oxidoreductase [Vicinamibacterales bacterium]